MVGVAWRLVELSLNFVVRRLHFRPRQLWAGAIMHCSLKCLQAVDLLFGLRGTLGEFDCFLLGATHPAKKLITGIICETNSLGVLI